MCQPAAPPRDIAPVDVGPERQARASAERFEFPTVIAVLEHLGSLGSRYFCFDRRRRSDPVELHCSNLTEVAIGVEGVPTRAAEPGQLAPA
jgi:hypothetical protein